MNHLKTYPRRELWDYIANAQEDAELKRLSDLQRAINQSKEEFKTGKRERLSTVFFEHFKQ